MAVFTTRRWGPLIERHSSDPRGQSRHGSSAAGHSYNIDMPATESFPSTSGTKERNHVFYPMNEKNVNDIKKIAIYFHGLVRDGEYAEDSDDFSGFKKQPSWLSWLNNEPNTRVYIASYDRYGKAYEKTGQADLYALGDILFEGVLNVRNIHRNWWNDCHVILIGHGVGGLAIKQLILQAESAPSTENEGSDEDLGLSFLNRLAGVFYFSTPHSNMADLTRILGRSKSLVGAALAALGKVTQRLNHQFMERRKALVIPTAEISETLPTKVGKFNDLVVSEASARMDVDVFMTAQADHFNVCEIGGRSDYRYQFLLQQIDEWVHSAQRRTRAKVHSAQRRTRAKVYVSDS